MDGNEMTSAMSKNTGDGELDEIFADYGEVRYPNENDFNRMKTAIKKWSAQEANKAQQQLLQGLMEEKKEFEGRIDDVPVYLHAVPVSVIQNKLEGLS